MLCSASPTTKKLNVKSPSKRDCGSVRVRPRPTQTKIATLSAAMAQVAGPRLSKAVNSTVPGITTSAGASGVAPYARTYASIGPVANKPMASAVASKCLADAGRPSQKSNAKQNTNEKMEGTNGAPTQA